MMMLAAYLCTITVVVQASLHEDCKHVFNGIYMYNNCYFKDERNSDFYHHMARCMGLGGIQYRSYIAHLLSSAILQVMLRLSPEAPATWVTYFGTRDSKPAEADLNATYWKYRWYYGTADDQFIDQDLTKTYVVQNIERRVNEVHDTPNTAMQLYFDGNPHKARQSDWIISAPQSAFCQINDNKREFEVTGFNIRLTRSPILETWNSTTKAECIHVCVRHLLCMGFNSHTDDGVCEILTWTAVDAGNQHLHYEIGWIHFERKL